MKARQQKQQEIHDQIAQLEQKTHILIADALLGKTNPGQGYSFEEFKKGY